jgi:hypothetical protein
MTEVNYYKIFCTTDNKFEYVWDVVPPIKCPVNASHTIDTNSIAIVRTVSQNTVMIEEEETPTGGHFRVETIKMSIDANETKSLDVTWPIPVSILEVVLLPTAGMEGDKVSVGVAPNATIGALGADANSGDTILTVSSTVFLYAELGFYIRLTDGVNTNQCNRIKSIDKVNSQITVETALTNSFSAVTPTYVQMTVYMMKDYEIGLSGVPLELGKSKIGGSYIPAGRVSRITYENTTASAKTFRAAVEYLY